MRDFFATVLLFFCLLTLSLPARASETVLYKDGETALEGYWAPSTCPPSDLPAPVIMIAHQWMGLTDYERGRADQLASQCYNAFALDMYGQDIRPSNKTEAAQQAGLYKSDAARARRRIAAALDYVRSRSGNEATRIAAIGYCFGGSMVLELARSGAALSGIVSFHGGLATPDPVTNPGIIRTPVQIHHGADDPFVTPEEIERFTREMKDSGADWTMTVYSGAVHAFTQKEAGNDPSAGAAYNESADRRSWMALLAFLDEVFAPDK